MPSEHRRKQCAVGARVDFLNLVILQVLDYPGFHVRLSQERIDWFRDYAKRNGKSMSAIIKEYIEELYQQDQAGA